MKAYTDGVYVWAVARAKSRQTLVDYYATWCRRLTPGAVHGMRISDDWQPWDPLHLPHRATHAEAQADLDKYADAAGWKVKNDL